MNFTRDYKDELEGDFLACKPGNVAEGLEVVCTLGIPIIGTAVLLNGLWLLQITYTERRHRKLLARQTRDAACLPDARNSLRNSGRVHLVESDAIATFSNKEKRLLVNGASAVGISLVRLVYGFGTMYPTTHIRGQIGDAIGKKQRYISRQYDCVVVILMRAVDSTGC